MITLRVKKERKPGECRVALTPSGAKQLLDIFPNLFIFVEPDAGLASGFTDNNYQETSERIGVAGHNYDMDGVDILLGVKEILLEEYNILRRAKPGTAIACFWHVMAPKAQNIISEQQLIPVWLESMPGTLKAMSTITGKMSVDVACHYLRKNFINGTFAGRGVLPENATLTILGAAGNLGQAAYAASHHRFAKIIALEIKDRIMKPYPMALESREWREANEENILRSLVESDVVISAVHIPGKENPRPITRAMMQEWGTTKPYAVLVDPAIDQGGSSETSRPTTHQNPAYLEENILHYCVPNMPGAIPQTSTPALEQALLPNLIELIKKTAQREGMGY